MGINLREMIEGGTIADAELFAGAVILTYTLNLNFYEQIIAPSMDGAGVANVLIIADPDGYTGAMEMGAQSVTDAGMRYVCTPLNRGSKGILHAKSLFMAGPRYGRLFIGSGNLTMHGFGRNLELFSYFEFDSSNPIAENHYAFVRIWKLLSHLNRGALMPRTAREQLDQLAEKATWLSSDVAEPPDFRIWDDLQEPIWAQLERWRNQNNLVKPLRSLLVVSPYYDEDVSTLKHIVETSKPTKTTVYLNPAATNLEGKLLKKTLGRKSGKLVVHGIESKGGRHKRHLHAKAIVGIEDNGAWCLTGSANLTRPALIQSWEQGGNLELVTFRWMPQRTTFDYLFEDKAIRIREISIDEITRQEDEPSERVARSEASFVLTELTARGKTLEGKMSDLPANSSNGWLQFLKTGKAFPVTIDSSQEFQVHLPHPLERAEAARLELGGHFTPYRWIDQPEELARFGSRTYHAQIKAKLETFDGAEKLFRELMDFLLTRLEPQRVTDADHSKRAERVRRHVSTRDKATDGISPPPPSDFIADENLLDQINRRIVEYHQPFERSTYSLRDLFSLVLLRLTAEVKIPEVVSEDGEIDDELAQQSSAEQEERRISIQQSLRDYIVRYCRRYGQRLCDAEFIQRVDPKLLFENHFTLGRILLEFADKISEFSFLDLKECFWWVWAPLVWTSIVELDGEPALGSLGAKHSRDEIISAWHDSGMPSMSVLTMTRIFGTPPDWIDGIGNIKRVQEYMVVQEFIAKMKNMLGESAFESVPEVLLQARGVRFVVEISDPVSQSSPEYHHVITAKFNELASYVSPPDRWYGLLRELHDLEMKGLGQTERADVIARVIRENGRGHLLQYRSSRVPILRTRWGKNDCPKCNIEQTQQNRNWLAEGKLVLCSYHKDALIYWQPILPQSILQILLQD